MEQKYIYSMFVSYRALEKVIREINNFIRKDATNDISIIGIDERYMRSFRDKNRNLCEICISSKTLDNFDILWHGKFGKMLRTTLNYNLDKVQKSIYYSIVLRPSTYKFKPYNERIQKKFFIPF